MGRMKDKATINASGLVGMYGGVFQINYIDTIPQGTRRKTCCRS